VKTFRMYIDTGLSTVAAFGFNFAQINEEKSFISLLYTFGACDDDKSRSNLIVLFFSIFLNANKKVLPNLCKNFIISLSV